MMNDNNNKGYTWQKPLASEEKDFMVLDGLSQEDFQDKEPGINGSGNSNKQEDKNLKTLNSFGINLTQKAANGELDPMIGRDKEVERLIQILCRLKKKQSCTHRRARCR